VTVTEPASHRATFRHRMALLGGDPAFPDGLPLTQVVVPDRQPLLRRLDRILDSGQLTNGRTVR
jgi:hypothetical protein